jgi:phosphoribosylformylglycinamidine synthase I
MLKSAVIVFPGSNCDHDMFHALKLLGHEVRYVWHKNPNLDEFELVVLPGGFSYGDYLRAGAIAHFSPIMQEVIRFANRGRFVIGICNGFQVLAEAGLLPGALLRNQNLRFLCQSVYLRVENPTTHFTNAITSTKPLKIPIAHGEGNYFIGDSGLEEIKAHRQIIFRYVDKDNNMVPEANPNGSLDNIAGVINKAGNILGMMPHPERAVEVMIGSADGRAIFESLTQSKKTKMETLSHA